MSIQCIIFTTHTESIHKEPVCPKSRLYELDKAQQLSDTHVHGEYLHDRPAP